MRARFIICSSLFLVLAACSSDEGGKNNNGSGGKDSGQGGEASSNGGNKPAAGSNAGGSAGKPSSSIGGGPGHSGPMFAGAECPTDLGLPDAYGLPNVKAQMEGQNARITFDPQADAADYRVYALPKSMVTGDTIDGAIYRCAGTYEVPFPAIDDGTKPDSPGIRTRVQSNVNGFDRTAADATLGYVYTTPADDRIPVYALGNPHVKADNAACYYMRWPESRVKKYTTSEEERKDLLSKRWRDDGIVFYVPKAGAEGTAPVYYAPQKEDDFSAVFYVTGKEKDKRAADGVSVTEAFSVYTDAKEGAEPLRRVFYQQTCGRSHDELTAGVARFNKAYEQGSQPVAELHFSGITEEMTLVVESLDQQCPYQGALAPTSHPAHVEPFGAEMINYPAFQTPDELMGASPTGELFVNGQGPDTNKPKATARACVKVKPEPAPELDFFYDGAVEEYSEGKNTGYQTFETESPTFNVQFTNVETESWSIGNLFGEIWATYSDKAADTNGKLRITPKKRATLADDKYLHATMEVDTVSSQRRYPQMLISNAEWPVQDNLATSGTAIVQVFGGVTEALEVQIEFCDHRTWDVNDQCPKLPLYTLKGAEGDFLAPAPEINGFQGTDRTVRFDVYASTSRIYVFTNTQPYGCADLPTGKLEAGNATVTFGDVLYHSAVDLAEWYKFHVEKMQVYTSRHFSNLGFSSNVSQPSWDESRLPCVAASELK